MNKKPWQSRTLLLNGVLGLASFVMLFWDGGAVVKPWIDAHAVEIGMFWSVANIILRVVTKEKIVLAE